MAAVNRTHPLKKSFEILEREGDIKAHQRSFERPLSSRFIGKRDKPFFLFTSFSLFAAEDAFIYIHINFVFIYWKQKGISFQHSYLRLQTGGCGAAEID